MRLNAYYPVSIVTHGLGLNVTILSYDGSLDYGIVAARSAMPDLALFTRNLEAAHRELLATTRKKPAKAKRATKAAKAKKVKTR
jgi:hypothetical protein